MIGLGKTTRSWIPGTRICEFRGQGRLIGTVEGRAEGGRKRFGEMAIGLFIGGHSCKADANDIAWHRRP